MHRRYTTLWQHHLHPSDSPHRHGHSVYNTDNPSWHCHSACWISPADLCHEHKPQRCTSHCHPCPQQSACCHPRYDWLSCRRLSYSSAVHLRYIYNSLLSLHRIQSADSNRRKYLSLSYFLRFLWSDFRWHHRNRRFLLSLHLQQYLWSSLSD